MLLVSHPTGNANVRALLEGAHRSGCLGMYATAVGFPGAPRWFGLLPSPARSELTRRTVALAPKLVNSAPLRESIRLLATKLGLDALVRHETGWACIDEVYRHLDARVASNLATWAASRRLTVAYAYEDGALATLREARQRGLVAAYDLPIAYGPTARRLLDEEAQRHPEWEPTLVGTRDSTRKLERKAAELDAADVVVCPSRFVLESIPPALRRGRRCIVAQFGSPPVTANEPWQRPTRSDRRIRFLFAGSMSQRKGLADVFAAFALLDRSDIELVVLGSPLLPMAFYRRHGGEFTHEGTRPHAQVLQLMDSCDVLVLPSIVEGRALVQQEAMSRGLPIIVTPNAGGEDLVEDARTGFLVPIRSPEAIAEKINWIAEHRDVLPEMSRQARCMAARYTWAAYADTVLAAFDLRAPSDTLASTSSRNQKAWSTAK